MRCNGQGSRWPVSQRHFLRAANVRSVVTLDATGEEMEGTRRIAGTLISSACG